MTRYYQFTPINLLLLCSIFFWMYQCSFQVIQFHHILRQSSNAWVHYVFLAPLLCFSYDIRLEKQKGDDSMKVYPVHPQCFLLLSNISDFDIWVGKSTQTCTSLQLKTIQSCIGYPVAQKKKIPFLVLCTRQGSMLSMCPQYTREKNT